MAKIAFLGTGNMGSGMAARLLGAGRDVAVYNRSPEKAEALKDAGATVSGTPREAADGAEAVFSMVGDDLASRSVWLGPDGALAAELPAGAFAVECSTLTRDRVFELAEMAKQRGLRFIDSPVTGLPDAAAVGKLTLFIGAATADLESARPLLDPLCEEIIHFGGIGAGSAYKLTVNLMGSVQIAAAAEGMLMAERAGLDLDQVAYALARGAAASPQVIRNSRRMAAADHAENITFAGRLRLKDTLYGLALADALGLDAAFGKVAEAAFRKLVDSGLGELNESKVIDVMQD